MYLNSPYNVAKSLRSMFSFYSYTWSDIKLMYAKVLVQTLKLYILYRHVKSSYYLWIGYERKYLIVCKSVFLEIAMQKDIYTAWDEGILLPQTERFMKKTSSINHVFMVTLHYSIISDMYYRTPRLTMNLMSLVKRRWVKTMKSYRNL